MRPFSIAFITFNRPQECLELLQSILLIDNRDDLLEEILIVNNGSTVDYTKVQEWINANKTLPIVYQYSPVNLGVSGGRNIIFSEAKGQYIIIPDDDCELTDPNMLTTIYKEFQKPYQDGRPLAVVCFGVFYFENRKRQWNAFPHKKQKKYSQLTSFYTYLFPGGGSAFDKYIIQKLGLYNEEIRFSQEEFDLALRIIQAGYSIGYIDTTSLLHKESPLARVLPPQRSLLDWINKSIIAYKYLPFKYFMSTAFMWGFKHLNEGGNLKTFISGISQIIKIPKSTKRTLLSMEAMTYLRKVEARLWF